MKRRQLLFQAAQITDGDQVNRSPGVMLFCASTGKVLAVGEPDEIGNVPDAEVRDFRRAVVIPALVNAHAHLDLTHIGPIPWTGDFVSWVDLVRSQRMTEPEHVRASVGDGAARSVAGGTVFIGDIAGTGAIAAVEALRESELAGVSFLEIFGNGAKEERAIASLDVLQQSLACAEGSGVRAGMQPHAPYSCSRRVYQEAAQRGLPLATHLAETQEELTFVRDAAGPLAALLKRLGVWDESIRPTGLHPIDYLTDVLAEHPFLAAHLNYLEDRHLDQLADWPISVVYCPRASAYFGHRIPHRYRDMLDRGINVALGTDSILCLDTPDRISVLDEMRLLYQRDGVDPQMLLRMGTLNGARALGIDPVHVTFSTGSTPGLLALPFDNQSETEPLRQVLTSAASIAQLELVSMPFSHRSQGEFAYRG